MNPEVAAHRIAAEKALGKPLPRGVVVHHFDKDRSNNRNNNLVICEDQTYHHLLHSRQRAKDAGANLNWRKCTKCREYDAPENLLFDRIKSRSQMWYIRIQHPNCTEAPKVIKSKPKQHFSNTQNLLRKGRLVKITDFGLICSRTAGDLFELSPDIFIHRQSLFVGWDGGKFENVTLPKEVEK